MRVSVSSYNEEGVGAERAYKLRFLRQRQFLLSGQQERFGCLGTAAGQQYLLASQAHSSELLITALPTIIKTLSVSRLPYTWSIQDATKPEYFQGKILIINYYYY